MVKTDTKTAIITGVSGQDASFLSELLLGKDYKIIGWRRRKSNTKNISHLFDNPNFSCETVDITHQGQVYESIMTHSPSEFYNFAAMSSVVECEKNPQQAFEINFNGVVNCLEGIHQYSPTTKFFQACHDENTKIVTENGIKEYSDVSVGEKVYTVNLGSNKIELRPVHKKLEYDYCGKMIYINNGGISQSITPNHTVLYIVSNTFSNIIHESQAAVYVDLDVESTLIPYTTFSLSNLSSGNNEIPEYGLSFLYVYKSDIYSDFYNGKVWCLEVEDNHNFLVSRNGKWSFSGNSSSEMYSSGDSAGHIHEETRHTPSSVYGCSKSNSHNLVKFYRNQYGIHANSGILCNHISCRRQDHFVDRKIIKWVVDLRRNNVLPENNSIVLGNTLLSRDWLSAEDVVLGAYLMLQQDKANDYILSYGESFSILQFLRIVLQTAGFSTEHLFRCYRIDQSLFRDNDSVGIVACNWKAECYLDWKPSLTFRELVSSLVYKELERRHREKLSGSEIQRVEEGDFM